MTIRLLPARGRIARPWKNGGGVTHDVAVFPEGASDEDFLWRASIATIAAAGLFSTFPGVDRAFLLLSGELAITIGEDEERRVTPGSPALLFGGEAPVRAAPVRGLCTALNIMARHGPVAARLDRWTAPRPTAADALLIVGTEPAVITCGEAAFDLAAGDALLLDRPADLSAVAGPVLAAELFYAAA